MCQTRSNRCLKDVCYVSLQQLHVGRELHMSCDVICLTSPNPNLTQSETPDVDFTSETNVFYVKPLNLTGFICYMSFCYSNEYICSVAYNNLLFSPKQNFIKSQDSPYTLKLTCNHDAYSLCFGHTEMFRSSALRTHPHHAHRVAFTHNHVAWNVHSLTS